MNAADDIGQEIEQEEQADRTISACRRRVHYLVEKNPRLLVQIGIQVKFLSLGRMAIRVVSFTDQDLLWTGSVKVGMQVVQPLLEDIRRLKRA